MSRDHEERRWEKEKNGYTSKRIPIDHIDLFQPTRTVILPRFQFEHRVQSLFVARIGWKYSIKNMVYKFRVQRDATGNVIRLN